MLKAAFECGPEKYQFSSNYELRVHVYTCTHTYTTFIQTIHNRKKIPLLCIFQIERLTVHMSNTRYSTQKAKKSIFTKSKNPKIQK